ncbi:MAG: bifunctional 4-hydroxy-2-oxoglutarate aldolase/2-dehydro-3-deoxy-phosphogluconate aldolase [Pseudolysinimonas sp.]
MRSVETTWFDELFARRRVMIILRGLSTSTTISIVEQAWELGIDAVEIPVQSPESAQTLAELAQIARAAGRSIGAGTILTPEDAARAAEAGAAYGVSPHFDATVSAACRDLALPLLPGVATASEVARASAVGHIWLKAFPATALGATWAAMLKGPFPDTKFVATGGIAPIDASRFLSDGYSAVSVGSAVTDPSALSILAALD